MQEPLKDLTLVAGEIYLTLFTFFIIHLGHKMVLLLLRRDPELFLEAAEKYVEVSRMHMEAWSKVGIKAFVSHDDMVWSEGPFVHPSFYRKVIFPRYAELWAVLKRAGKKVLFCSDANYSMFVDDIAKAGADGIVIETMTDLAEAKLAVAAARDTGLPVAASMAFDSGRDKDRTITGVTPEQAAQELTAQGADVIGANCGLGIAGYVPICQRLRGATDRPIWIKPNAGLPEMVEGRVVYKTTPQEFAAFVPALLEAGASFVGGCCGTGPEFVRAMKETVRSWKRP
jgi:hypothetical protein